MKDGEDRPLLTIDLDAVAGNWRALAEVAAPAEAAAVCKADAYGLGIREIAPVLAEAGARTFFVATAPEGAELRDCIPRTATTYVLNGVSQGDLGDVLANGLRPVLSTPGQLADAIAHGRAAATRVPCAIHFDTGMRRLGLPTAELMNLIDDSDALSYLDVEVLMSHLASADEPASPANGAQATAFEAAVERAGPAFPHARRSLAATAGIVLGRRYRHDLVRPGIGLYGGLHFPDARPVVRLEAPIIQIQMVEPGDPVGYGGSWRPARPSRVATLPIGYADGVLRCLSNRGTLRTGGVAVPIAGRVNMDLATVDVTDAPGIEVGGMVEFLGPERGIDAWAEEAGTIGHEVLTALGGGRCRRRYVRGEAKAGAA